MCFCNRAALTLPDQEMRMWGLTLEKCINVNKYIERSSNRVSQQQQCSKKFYALEFLHCVWPLHMIPLDRHSLLIQSRSCLVQEAWFHSQRPWNECRGFWLHPDCWTCSGTGKIVMLNPYGVRCYHFHTLWHDSQNVVLLSHWPFATSEAGAQSWAFNIFPLQKKVNQDKLVL